jgi:excisionase family DNA binding protein
MGLLTVKDAAGLLKVSEATVYKLCARRKLAHLRVGTARGAIHFRAEDLLAFVESCKVEPGSLTNARSLKHIKLPSNP